MARKLILHIGMGKTGTSALQAALHRNEWALGASGYVYPSFAVLPAGNQGEFNHNILANCLYKGDQGLLENFKEILIKASSSGIPIISAENLFVFPEKAFVLGDDKRFSYDDKECFIEELRRWLEPEFTDIHIIVYMRRQDEVVQAWANQMSKRTLKFVATPAFIEEKMALNLNYYRNLSCWENIFADAVFSVRVYEQGQIDDTILDFCKLLQIDKLIYPEFDRGLDHNPRISRQGMEFMNCLRGHDFDPDLWGQISNLIWEYSSSTSLGLAEEHNLLSHQEKIKLLDRYRADNRAVARNYLDRHELFLREPQNITPAEPLNLEMAIDFAAYLTKEIYQGKQSAPIGPKPPIRPPEATRVKRIVRSLVSRVVSLRKSNPANLLCDESLKVLRDHIQDEFVLITFASSEYLFLLRNWMAHLKDIKGPPFVVVALDATTSKFCADHQCPHVAAFQSDNFTRKDLWEIRVRIFRELVDGDISFIHSDLDAIWVQKPDSAFWGSRQTPFVFSQGTFWPPEIFKRCGFVLCCGLFAIRHGSESRRLFADIEKVMGLYRCDQEAFNNVILKKFSGLFSGHNYEIFFRDHRIRCSRNQEVLEVKPQRAKLCLIPHHRCSRHPGTPREKETVIMHPYLSGSLEERLVELRKMGLIHASLNSG